MSSSQQAATNNKPVTSIVDHLFKEFLAKKSEVLQRENTDASQQSVKEEKYNIRNDIDRDASDLNEQIGTTKHDERHEKKKEKKHKKHKHKEKGHSKKKHKHRRHHSDKEPDMLDVKNYSSPERWENNELKIDTDSSSEIANALSRSDGMNQHLNLPAGDVNNSGTEVDDRNGDLQSNDKLHKKHKKDKDGRKPDTAGHPMKLEHLWQEDEVSDPDLDQISKQPSGQDESTTESEVTANAVGVSWMTLPKELEKNPEVNADTWMKLPDDLVDLERGHFSDNDFSHRKVSDNPQGDDSSQLKTDVSDQPSLKLDIKIDISKVAKVLPPPTHITKEVVSSIKSTLISNAQKLDQSSADDLKVFCDGMEIKQEHAESKPLSGKMKLGIKISETSAALISSGKKAEENPSDAKTEEGEITDSAASSHRDGSVDKMQDGHSSSSEISRKEARYHKYKRICFYVHVTVCRRKTHSLEESADFF
ncbi:hypothetical protein LSH36_92g04007 [Paralvinella palmiformis]|uniref:Uncharacterized protein n=1 Tax=Paralvinella palmiformis TaxID=53620 RepID=A0AAD9NBR5_9ANNE|nr:hypothetical protein LSH36_92g04007 [Paralvinella palmiformis]